MLVTPRYFMRFKEWIIKEIGDNGAGGEAPVQRPDLFATALQGFDKKAEPPNQKKHTPTKKYAVKIKR